MTENKPDIIQYETTGTCCQVMCVAIEDNKIVDAEFFGGCHGNLQGIKNLIKGMSVDKVIENCKGIKCGDKPTSCPDQLATCLIEYKNRKQAEKLN